MRQATRRTFMATALSPLAAACWLCCGGVATAQESGVQAPSDASPKDQCEITVIAAPLQFRQFDQVEITGVGIADPQSKLPQALQVICRRQVERSPATLPSELLQQLPALIPPHGTRPAGTVDVAAVHGHMAGTLVLINGQRLPKTGHADGLTGGDAVDLRFLPLSAIERVEVQTPGASSAMGSDGLAGIVNILTRKTRGLTLGTESLTPAQGTGYGQALNVSWGLGNLRSLGHSFQLHATLNQSTPGLVSPARQSLRVMPATTRSQWFMEGEWALNNHWTGFGHLLGSRETLPSQAVLGSNGAVSPSVMGSTAWPLTHSEQGHMNQWRVGLKGPWQQWDVVASASSGQARQQLHTQAEASDLTTPDTNWQARLERLQALPALAEQRYDNRLQTVSIQALRELDSPPQGPRTLGLGWQWQQEAVNTFTQTPDATPWQGQRQHWAVHGELKTPVADHHEISASLRYNHHSDEVSAQTGQLAWKWRPATDFLMRASLGTGFRVPGLDQRSPHVSRSWLIWDPDLQTELRVQRRGQANLQAEQSTHLNWGFRLEPHPRWTLGADMWQLDVRQSIGYPGPVALRAMGQLLNDAQGPYLDAVATNLGRRRQQGIDYDSEWRLPTDAGLWRLSIKGVLYLKSNLRETATGRTVSDLAEVSPATETVTPRHKMMLGASIERYQWVFMGQMRYRSTYREPLVWPWVAQAADASVMRQVPANWRLDLGTQWALSRQLSVSAWLLDATDTGRDLALATTSPLQGNDMLRLEDLGRSIKLKAEYKF